jgi:hypothetical protein
MLRKARNSDVDVDHCNNGKDQRDDKDDRVRCVQGRHVIPLDMVKQSIITERARLFAVQEVLNVFGHSFFSFLAILADSRLDASCFCIRGTTRHSNRGRRPGRTRSDCLSRWTQTQVTLKRICSIDLASGQKGRFGRRSATSGLPRSTDVIRPAWLVRLVP